MLNEFAELKESGQRQRAKSGLGDDILLEQAAVVDLTPKMKVSISKRTSQAVDNHSHMLMTGQNFGNSSIFD